MRAAPACPPFAERRLPPFPCRGAGKLAEASNTVNGVVLKSAEPSDAAKPTKHWRLYVFKGKEARGGEPCLRA